MDLTIFDGLQHISSTIREYLISSDISILIFILDEVWRTRDHKFTPEEWNI